MAYVPEVEAEYMIEMKKERPCHPAHSALIREHEQGVVFDDPVWDFEKIFARFSVVYFGASRRALPWPSWGRRGWRS